MNSCKICGSYAVNPHRHGREKGVDLDLCDVCYWQTRAEERQAKIDALMLEYCPDEMTEQQALRWAAAQVGPQSGK